LFSDVYKNRRVLLTGHTGFKGSWLALWLCMMGAEVTGIALDPDTGPSHWDLLKIDMRDHRIDIRDEAALRRAVTEAQPDIVFHLAAQPLVRKSYRVPLETWSTNVVGTANVLDTCRDVADLRAIVVVTSDKCYENLETARPFREDDRLGGHDPYSASKAGSELVAASYRDAFFGGTETLLATARAGNVIGGGDWSEDRLIPDVVRATGKGESLPVRSPHATRPWQHVLESLSGYLLLGQNLLAGKKDFQGGWNFGPGNSEAMTVSGVLEQLQKHWPDLAWHVDGMPALHEAKMLQLDSGKAHRQLRWNPILTPEQMFSMTAAWYRRFYDGGDVMSGQQLEEYCAFAKKAGAVWA
jgi:CDP-glucose 4,6-dehydratase